MLSPLSFWEVFQEVEESSWVSLGREAQSRWFASSKECVLPCPPFSTELAVTPYHMVIQGGF